MLALFYNGIVFGSLLFLIASGLTLVLGVLRIINIAHASMFLLGAYVAWFTATSLQVNVFLSIVIGALVVGFVGILMERGLRILYGRPPEYQILFTYAIVLIIYDLQLSLFGPVAKTVPVPEIFSGATRVLAWNLPTIGFLIMAVSVAILIFLHYFINRTRIGINTQAVSFNPQVAAILGINPRRMFMLVFFLGACIGGLGGGFAGMYLPVTPPLWGLLNVLAFAVLVVGGVGSIEGAYIGAIIIGVLYSFGVYHFASISIVFPFMVMIFILAFRPKGLFGREML